MEERRRRIWPWALYAILVAAAVALVCSGNVPGPYMNSRHAVIVNDDESVGREFEDTIKRAERVKTRSEEDGQ
jgi:hypothetical protein